MKLSDRDALARSPMLRDAPREIAERLAIGAFVQTLPKGALLFEQGQEAEFLHILLEGRCGLIGYRTDGEECVVEIMQTGDSFIIPAVMLEAPYLMGARVLETSRIVMIAAETFRRAVEVEPKLMAATALELARYWRILVRQIKDLKLRTAPERIAAHLSGLSKDRKNGAAVLQIEEDFRAIAARLGMTPETWSRSIKLLDSIGVQTAGKTVRIADVEKLRAYSRFDDLV